MKETRKYTVVKKMDTSFLFPRNHSLPSVVWGKTPIDILTCKIQQYQRDRVNVFWTPHQPQEGESKSLLHTSDQSKNLLSNYLSISTAFRKSKCVKSDSKTHCKYLLVKQGHHHKNGPGKDWHIQSCILLWFSEAILCKVECAVCIPEFSSPEKAGAA